MLTVVEEGLKAMVVEAAPGFVLAPATAAA